MLIHSKRLLSTSTQHSKYRFYDLIKHSNRSPTHNKLPVSVLENKNSLENESDKKRKAAEAKIAKVFGGRIKGEDRQSSSRINVGEPRIIGGIKVPDKPTEPDNCCMSGCVNCVWEIYNDDVKDWNIQRKKAALQLLARGGVWPEDFHPPIELLKPENLPPSLALQASETGHKEDDQPWEKVPVQIRVFAEMEKKIKSKKKKQKPVSI